MEQWGSKVTKKNQTLTNTISTDSQEIMLKCSKGRNSCFFMHLKPGSIKNMVHFLCNISYSNLVFSGKKIKN